MAFVELVAHQIVARLFRRRAADRIDQAILGHAGRARLRQRRQQHRAAHVDGRIGHHQLGVGPGDQPVVRRRRRDLVGREVLLQPRIRILRRDLRIGRPQRAGFRERLARRLAPMRRRGEFIERVDGNGAEHAEFYRHRFLEHRAALRLLDVMGERRPGQRNAAALGLGRGRLRFRAADHRHAALAARDALRRLVNVADRTLAADRAVIAMRRRDAEPLGQLLLGIAVAPAQEVDDIERAEIAEQLCPAIGFRAPHRVFEQRQRLPPGGDVLGPVDNFADADDDGNAVFGEGGVLGIFSCFAFLGDSYVVVLVPSLRGAQRRSNPSLGKESMDCFASLAMTWRGLHSSISAFICSTASAKSSLNSCTTAPADFTLSIRPTPWPTK